MSLLSHICALLREKFSVVEDHPSPQLHRRPSAPPRLGVVDTPAPDLSSMSLSGRYAQMFQDLRSSIPSNCRWLVPEDIKPVGEHQIAAGGFTNIWEATYDGRKVVLKSYCYSMTSDVARIVARFLNEVRACSHLQCRDVDIVPFVGVYSTDAHPLGLVYEYMDGLSLKQHLGNEPNVGRLKLLVEIVRCLSRIHNLGIDHEDLQTMVPHIAGLGNATTLPHSKAWTVEGRTGSDRLSRRRAPELTCPGTLPNANDPAHPTEVSDMYAFGVMTWEVLTGRLPFPEMTEIAATYSMMSGARPPRPDHHEISDRVWYMIERCWHQIPSKRMSAEEAIELLETELRGTSSP